MAVAFKKGNQRAVGMQVTESQNDTVGIVVWASSNGHNLQQVASGARVIPAIPEGTDLAGDWHDTEPIPAWGWVLLISNGQHEGELLAFHNSEALSDAGWKPDEEHA
jgi:hypothetical protein